METSTPRKPLRFGCPACGIRLVVDQSIAGTEGPCPSCGARIVAPPIEASKSLVEKEAAPVSMKPRPSSRKRASVDEESVKEPLVESAQVSAEVPSQVSKDSASRRAISPTSMVSQQYQEKQNALTFFKILAAVLVVAAIALGTYYVLKSAA